ncbi:MAG TPA: tetratricopeptide repeat protein [Myxococcales bacterium]|jgi:tetratricopeptide (TPR) repeat protein
MTRALRVGLGLLLGAFLVLVAMLAIRDVLRGSLGIAPFVLLVLMGVGLGFLARWLVRGGTKASKSVTVLTQDGAVQNMDAAFLKEPNPKVGDAVDLSAMRGVVPSQLPTGEAKAALELADQRVRNSEWAGAQVLYQEALAKHPSTAPMSLANIGVCHFMLGQFDAAIESYRRAQAAGANPITMAENIAEAEEAKARSKT